MEHKTTKQHKRRRDALIPKGIPRWLRVYDNGGGFTSFCRKCLNYSDADFCDVSQCGHKTVCGYPEKGSFDRYTVVFTGHYKGREGCDYIGMSQHPSHPQGFGQHGHHASQSDVGGSGFPPAVGDRGDLGRRITFQTLPPDCQRLALLTYMAIWGLMENNKKEDVV